MQRVAPALAAFPVAVGLMLGGGAATAATPDDQVANVAHRGASLKAPENTKSAVTQAIADKADFLGIDVRLSRDGVPVVVHDRYLARTTNAEEVFPERSPWAVEDLSLSELRRLDAGSWKSSTYTGERIMTLGELLREVGPSSTGIMLEIKEPQAYGGMAGIGEAVMGEVRRNWTELPSNRRLVIQSFDHEFLRQLNNSYSEYRIGLIGNVASADLGKYSFADNVQLNQATVTKEYITEAHKPPPVLVGAWTVDDTPRMAELVDLGIDGITTNRPDVLRGFLTSRGLVYQPERWPARKTETPAWTVWTPRSALIGTRVTVNARLVAADGSPAQWQWAAVQRRVNGRWRTLQFRATDSGGFFSTTVKATLGLRLRVVSAAGGDYPVARSAARSVDVRRYPTKIRLFGQSEITKGARARLEVRWRASDGRRITGTAALGRWMPDGTWRLLKEFTVRDGSRRLYVRPTRTTRFEVRGRQGSWYNGDVDGHRVLVTR